jgi:Zn-dependent metalloprotease
MKFLGNSRVCLVTALAVLLPCSAFAQAQARGRGRDRSAEVHKLQAETKADISVHSVTGTPRFVASHQKGNSLAKGVAKNATATEKSAAFFHQYGDAFGVTQFETELQLTKQDQERDGASHLTYQQHYLGVPVFGAVMKSHVDADGTLSVVNGTFIPDININATPSLSADAAATNALTQIKGGSAGVQVVSNKLYVYQLGLTKGVDEGKYLVYEVEVSDGGNRHEYLYIDAVTGDLVDRVTGVYDAMNRRAYNGNGSLNSIPPNYPNTPFWVEGQAFPTGNTEADNMLISSKETYDYYLHAFGRDSFDGNGGRMDSIFNRGNACPNASWNGIFISFCPGMTTDDVTAHEWSHAYTQYTHGLIYAYQSGALNESYSDIHGETVDRINNRMTDTPDAARTGACSVFQPFQPVVEITSPVANKAKYNAGIPVGWGPAWGNTGPTGDVVKATAAPSALAGLTPAQIAAGRVEEGCGPYDATVTAAVSGKMAFVDRGNCSFKYKVLFAQNAGAIGIIIGNVASSGPVGGMADVPAVTTVITIPSGLISFPDANNIRAAFTANNVLTASLHRDPPAVTDNSVRWLVGEDDTAAGLTGALRDMSAPNCFLNPATVTDKYYSCDAGDNGGVHNNSGVPNKAYQLVVDGGTFNGQTITGIGLTKAAHIYFRAENLYQNPATNFAEHADAIEQSCSDLVGVNLNSLTDGTPSGQTITAQDCAEVAKALLATEMRTPPTQCGFKPYLGQNPPDRCVAGSSAVDLYSNNFEAAPNGWSVSHQAVDPILFTDRNWQWINKLPASREGSAFYGITPRGGDCNTNSEAGVLHLDSPAIALPEGAVNTKLTFDHYFTTEAGWDGGNLKMSVDGGAFAVVPAANFTYNTYNATLNPAPNNNDPLAGQPAFTGLGGTGGVNAWGRSVIDLTGAGAPGGSTVQLRWDVGNDSCTGYLGWYVDDVNVFTCLPDSTPQISINNIEVQEGNNGKQPIAVFTVSLDHASLQPITVRYKWGKGTAKNGTDYIPTEGKLTFQPLTLTQHVTVQIRGDNDKEGDEYFVVNITDPTNAGIAKSEGICTIRDDD